MRRATVFMTKLEVDPILKKEKGSASMISLDLKLLYPVEVTAMYYLIKYVPPQFQNFDGRGGNTLKHVMLP